MVTSNDEFRANLADLKTEVGRLSTDMHHGFDEIRASFAHLDETLELRFAQQRSHMEAVVRERLDNQTKLMVFSILGGLLTTAVIAIGAAAV